MVLLWAAFVAGVVPVWRLEVGGGSGEIRGQALATTAATPEGAVTFLKAPSRLPPSPLPSTQLVCRAKAQILAGLSDNSAPAVVTLLGVSFVVSLGWM